MLPTVHVIGIPIKTFGVFFALNFIAWGALVARRLREIGKPVDWAYEMVFAAIVGGLVGARGYYLLQNHQKLSFGNVFSGSGLIWYGGLIGGVVAMLIWAWRRNWISLALLDVAGPGLALGYAIGRIGCQVSGDGDYGRDWSGPWAMGYPKGTVPTHPGETVHPTPIYETLVMGLVAWVLWRMRFRARPGVLFAGYLVLGGLERFLVEFLRRNQHVVIGLTAAQIESFVMFVVGLVWLAIVARRDGGLLTPAGPVARRAPVPAAA